MESKLTLKLNSSVIEQAKTYAKKKNTSLSKLIESYLRMLVDPKQINEAVPLVKGLSGIINFPKKFEHKREYKNHILNKYNK